MAGNIFHRRTLLQMEILLCTGTVSQFIVATIVVTSFDRRHGQEEIDVAVFISCRLHAEFGAVWSLSTEFGSQRFSTYKYICILV